MHTNKYKSNYVLICKFYLYTVFILKIILLSHLRISKIAKNSGISKNVIIQNNIKNVSQSILFISNGTQILIIKI